MIVGLCGRPELNGTAALVVAPATVKEEVLLRTSGRVKVSGQASPWASAASAPFPTFACTQAPPQPHPHT